MLKNKSKLLTVLKIIFFVVYALVTIYLTYGLLDIILSPSENLSLELAVYLVFSVIILGSIGYGVSLVPAIIGLIYSIVKNAGKNQIIFFIITVLLPVITETVFIVLCGSFA